MRTQSLFYALLLSIFLTVSSPFRAVANIACATAVDGNPKYATLEMKTLFKRLDLNIGVKYLSQDERVQHLISVKNGLLIWPDGTLVNLRGNLHGFAMDASGNIYAINPNIDLNLKTYRGVRERIHHSTFLAGQPVAVAGRIIVHDGVIVYMDNNSGHYAPSKVLLAQFYIELERRGAILDQLKVFNYNTAPVNPDEFNKILEYTKQFPEIVRQEARIENLIRKSVPDIISETFLDTNISEIRSDIVMWTNQGLDDTSILENIERKYAQAAWPFDPLSLLNSWRTTRD